MTHLFYLRKKCHACVCMCESAGCQLIPTGVKRQETEAEVKLVSMEMMI